MKMHNSCFYNFKFFRQDTTNIYRDIGIDIDVIFLGNSKFEIDILISILPEFSAIWHVKAEMYYSKTQYMHNVYIKSTWNFELCNHDVQWRTSLGKDTVVLEFQWKVN